MEIDRWRKKIDEIDSKILHLINKRAEYSTAIGDIKFERNLPIYSPEREAEILGRVTAENPGPLQADAVRRIFERVIDESRKLEKDEAERMRRK